VARYTYTRAPRTVAELLDAIGRPDIPSTEVRMTCVGDVVEIDFGPYALTPDDEARLNAEMGRAGFRFVRKE